MIVVSKQLCIVSGLSCWMSDKYAPSFSPSHYMSLPPMGGEWRPFLCHTWCHMTRHEDYSHQNNTPKQFPLVFFPKQI